MPAAELSTTRRPGHPFDAFEVEEYAQSRAAMCTIAISAQQAGIGMTVAKRLEKDEAVRTRIQELRSGTKTTTTVSPAWILEQLKQNALEARDAGQFKASNEALKLAYELVSSDAGILQGVAEKLPSSTKDLRATLRGLLTSSSQEPINVPGTPMDDDDTEAAQ